MTIEKKLHLCRKTTRHNNEKIKQLREDKQIHQRKLVAIHDVDTATCCKIEKGERYARKEHLPIITGLLLVEEKELLTLWLAEKIVCEIIDENVAIDVLKVAKERVKRSLKNI